MRALRIPIRPARRRQASSHAPWLLVPLLLVFALYIIDATRGFGTEAVVLMSVFVLLMVSLRSQTRRG